MLEIKYYFEYMILNIFKKYTERNQKKKIIETIIDKINIDKKQKTVYLTSLEYMDDEGLESLYLSLKNFVKDVENKEMNDITKTNFSKISGLRKKDARKKQRDENSFGFLLNNL